MHQAFPQLFKSIRLFSSLTEPEINIIINAPENGVEEYGIKDVIFHEDDIGEHMYIVMEGLVEIYIGGEYSDRSGKRDTCIASIQEGEFFGENAALTQHTTRRTATARAAKPTKVFKVHKKYVLEATKHTTDVGGRFPPDEIRDMILKIPLFNVLNRDEIHNIRDWASIVEYKAGSFIYKPGNQADGIFVVLSGRIELLNLDDKGNPVVTASEGPEEYFGEVAFLPKGKGKHNHFARATSDCRLIKIPKDIFTNLLNRDPAIIEKIKIVQNLRALKIKKPGSRSNPAT
jgi:CRP-like cAMP-binding protein